MTPRPDADIARAAKLDRYAAHFTTARALDRRITLITGPTNSGKSHMALDILARAESGMALAPLRLLAHEFREALASRGVACSLSTGEERIPAEGARHLAATVEMCPMSEPLDVAVIDEAQLLYDADRGSAWTAAIMGAPARHVVVLGSPDCIPLVRSIAKLCGDQLKEVTKKRQGRLLVEEMSVRLRDLEQGDAVIAFSRRDVMQIRGELTRRGHRVAVVYGALSPEVRRAEAQRFRDGEADILVATDAIGMGLNLPVRRIIFSNLQKFDGTGVRGLLPQEVRQIGGRAGRYGHFEEGRVALLAGAGQASLLRRLMDAPSELAKDPRPLVAPDADIVAAVAAEMGAQSLVDVLLRISTAVLNRDDPNYRLADLSDRLKVAGAIDRSGLSLLDRWTYSLCPIDHRDYGVERLAQWAQSHAQGGRVAPPRAGQLPSPDRAAPENLEWAEKTYKRLLAWRWLSIRFPEIYPAMAEAVTESNRLDTWIEAALASRSNKRLLAAA